MTASWRERLPLPTRRLALLWAAATLLALLGIAARPLLWAALAADALLLSAFLLDAWRGRALGAELRAERQAPDLLLAFQPNRVRLALYNPGARPVSGQLLDPPPPGVEARGERVPFRLGPGARLEAEYLLLGPPRGVHPLGELHLRLEGPWGLACRQARVGAPRSLKCYPDLSDPEDALLLARPRREAGLARLRRLGEGREFDALRPYREGDDLRAIDWKASARRAELIAREYAPERNQAVVLLLDCGRHMVAREGGRTRLDHALEAALRLARTCLERGDAVGLLAFGPQVRASVPPARGRAQLRALLEASYRLQPELEESDYGAAYDLLARQLTRRALVCTFTEVVDADASRVLLSRTLALRPRHLPLLVTLRDAGLARLRTEAPPDTEGAYARAAAARLLREREAACHRLRAGGATVISAPTDRLGAEAINAYLRIKARGQL